jgi:hypothetical protein
MGFSHRIALPAFDAPLDEIDMGRRGSGDEDGVDLGRGKNLFGGGEALDAETSRNLPSRLAIDVEHPCELRARMRADVGGMHATDATAAKNGYGDHHSLPN